MNQRYSGVVLLTAGTFLAKNNPFVHRLDTLMTRMTRIAKNGLVDRNEKRSVNG